MNLLRNGMGWACCAALILGGSGRAEELVTIASWNIEHLGNRQPPQSPKALAEYIRLGGADILALQEIYDTDSTNELRNTTLDQVFAELNQGGACEWKYVLLRKNDPGDPESKRQNTGYAWNEKRVKPIGGPKKIEVVIAAEDIPAEADEGSAPFRRPPYAMQFTMGDAKTDLVLINLHLKSNSDGEELGRDIRALEAKALGEVMESIRADFGDSDVVVLGDLNCLSAGEPALASFAAAGLRDLNTSDQRTYLPGTGAPFDRFLVSHHPEKNKEFQFSRQYGLIAADEVAHDKALSDHAMILMSVRVMSDDDE